MGKREGDRLNIDEWISIFGSLSGTFTLSIEIRLGANSLGNGLSAFIRLTLLFTLQLFGGFGTKKCLCFGKERRVILKMLSFQLGPQSLVGAPCGGVSLTLSFFLRSGVMKPFLPFLARAASSRRARTSAFLRALSSALRFSS